MKGVKVTEIGEEIKFKKVWAELEPDKDFEPQPVKKCLRLTLVFI